jgi:hypothetical protein
MKVFTLILFIVVCLSGFSQTVNFKREDITPYGVTEIGGAMFFNDSIYLLIPANIRYGGKTAETSESKLISSKYKVWDIFKLDQTTGILENRSKKLPHPMDFALLTIQRLFIQTLNLNLLRIVIFLIRFSGK